jgi:HK97 family phage prohead protease
MKYKSVDVEVQESTPAGGRIRISTGSLDRDRDRVIPSGADIDAYMKNPVVQWGHNYRDPWATIGTTERLEIDANGITAEFVLREAANESDPMHVVRALWNQGLIRTASIGFNPKRETRNDQGGFDFTEWELLEWSLVPIPANQEALRLAVKSFETQDQPEGDAPTDPTPDIVDDTELPADVMEQLSAAVAALAETLGGK